jgi:copper(I)-binding protein
MLSGSIAMEVTMCKMSTLILATLILALFVGSTLAHAYLLGSVRPIGGSTTHTSPTVTIVYGGIFGPLVVAPTLCVQRAIDPQSRPSTGPRSLPPVTYSVTWETDSPDVQSTGGAYRITPAAADTSSIMAEQVWARPTAGAGTTGAAYFTLTNNGAPDQLIGASTPIAASAGAHETIDDNGVMKMRPLASIELAPGKPVTFRPGGYHVMLIGLKAPLKIGDSFPLTLSFAHAQPITVTVKVQAGGAGMGNASMPGMPGMR